MNKRITVNLNEIKKVNKFVNEMSTFEADIDIISRHYTCDAKSLLGILSFDLSKPVEAEIISDNVDELIRFNEVLEEFK